MEIVSMNLLKLNEAADVLGISYPTIKQWIYSGKIRSVKTAGGHHRIPQDEIDRILGAKKREVKGLPNGLTSISGRNKLFGTITEARFDGLLAQITIDVGGQIMTSIITSDSARNLGLKKGVDVYALVKATEVMIIRE
jgi:molybdopterin-binding protein